MPSPAKPVFFASPAKFDAWLARNGAKRTEVAVGYWKVGTGKPSMTWEQSVEVALRHGWIDGVRHSLGAESYTIRFTPRKATSNWSAVNLRTVRRLIAEGRMTPAGLAAYQARREDQATLQAYEQRRKATLEPADVRRFKADAKAWAFYSTTAPHYRSLTAHWIASAKKPETRDRRLAKLMAHSRAGKPVPPFVPRPGKGSPRRRSADSTDSGKSN